MSFFNKGGKTAEQKAQWAKTRLMLRGAVLVYLIFFIVIPMMNPETEDIDQISPAVRYAMVTFFVAACGGLSYITIKDYLNGKKEGRFSPEYYKDDNAPETDTDEIPEDENNDTADEYEDDEYEDYEDDEDEINDGED